jgi:glycosyltransferase involved in cell wall biosynthesis
MDKKLLIYIVSYERIEYTQGTIMAIDKVKPPNSQIIVCDNGSTDGTREWLTENQEKYSLGLIFPETNLRVGGSWTLLTKYFDKTDFDYVLLLDNDLWIKPDPNWFNLCMEIFELDSTRCSLGLAIDQIPGAFTLDGRIDPNFKNAKTYKTQQYYDTVYYAAARLDRFDIWHQTMANWPHEFIGDKIGRHYNMLGYKAAKLTPGFIYDISGYDFDNKNHEEYNRWFFSKEKNIEEYDLKIKLSKEIANSNEIKETFPKEIYELIYKD